MINRYKTNFNFIIISLLALLIFGCSSVPQNSSSSSPVAKEIKSAKTSDKNINNNPINTVINSDNSINVTDKEGLVKAKFLAVAWSELPNWESDDLQLAWAGYLRSCRILTKKNPNSWGEVCELASKYSKSPTNQEIQQYFAENFQAYSVLNEQNQHSGLITGYYEPLVYGSLKKDSRYRYPVLGVPDDLLTIDLANVYPQFATMRLRGKLKGKTIVAYPSRQEIVNSTIDDKNILLWLDDPVDLAFMQIQGSGRALLPDGKIIRLNYANQNGHPFNPIGRTLVKWGELKINEVSAQGIKNWIKKNPQRQDELLNTNPSYVFFRKVLPQVDPANPHLDPEQLGPIGALAVPLTSERSIAIDPSIIPLGSPIFLAMSLPGSTNNQEVKFNLVLAQDTGGAIKGAGRADFFYGFGDQAGNLAGKTKQNGRMWLIWPKNKLPGQ